MGFFFSSQESKEPPNRSKREKCWESRDIFFQCLDRINVVDPLRNDTQKLVKKECGTEDKQFQKDCVASWVKYFKQKRPFDKKKERILNEAKEEGAEVVQLPGYRK
ncbi:DEKNAAC101211 [Brettanomyces naardenensis]|uniref:DEKNAAC101211 n=1 Tax=Brettanomyces naardenensis TaxID=13370 RepID=A0A448YH56_BRENA|nr:DEKNAAC101211 [Brettanomyces naardenensis]